MLTHSPRPFSAASVVATPQGKVFLKRHHRSIRDAEGLHEEHSFISWLAQRTTLVQPPLATPTGETTATEGDWTYEVHPLAHGVDAYQDALSWTPFRSIHHAQSAGQAMAELHQAAKGYPAPRRKLQHLVSSFTIFANRNPIEAMERYLQPRPQLREYMERHNWKESFEASLIPIHKQLAPWTSYLEPLWTHNDFHPSNLSWSGTESNAEVTGVFDFGLADRTNAVHDIATAIERCVIDWLSIGESEVLHLDHLDALLSGYEELLPLSHGQARALIALLPLAHCEFALSESDYFLSILHSEEMTRQACDGYFYAHALWFQSLQGRRLLHHLEQWAEAKQSVNLQIEATI